MSSNSSNVILITGASAGMGRATALYLAEKGIATSITLVARRKEPLDELVIEMKTKYPTIETLIVIGDVSKEDDNKKMIDDTMSKFGSLHGMFINAGVYSGGKTIVETSQDDVDKLIDVNVKGVIYALRYGIPAIKASVGTDGKKTGSIVVNSSCMGASVIAPKSIGSSIYSGTKAFVNSLVESAAIENAPTIRVNGIMPGVIQTSILPVDDDTYQKIGAALQPLYGRPGQAIEVASLVSYLLSNEATLISGTIIKADGLWTLSGGAFPSS